MLSTNAIPTEIKSIGCITPDLVPGVHLIWWSCCSLSNIPPHICRWTGSMARWANRKISLHPQFWALIDLLSQFQELFAICQSLPGPASTKLGFCIALIRGGLVAAVMFFLTWRWAALLSPSRSIYLWAFYLSCFIRGNIALYTNFHATGIPYLN